MTDQKQPNWILSDTWAIGINSMNWITYKATTGKVKGWKAVAYHPTPYLCLQNLLNEALLHDVGNPDLVQHINQALRASINAYSAFAELMEALPPIPPKEDLCAALSKQEKAA